MNERTLSPTHAVRVLRIDSSVRGDASATRALTDRLIEALRRRHGGLEITRRDVAADVPHLDPAWVDANFTDPLSRTPGQQAALAGSDAFVREVQAADILVIGVPIYNFGVPAGLKAWIDQIARARLTFRFTSEGAEGLLGGKRAYLVVASDGTAAEGPADFATPYLRHMLGFLGITQVEVIAAAQKMDGESRVLKSAHARIEAVAAQAA